jgi:stage II sporulation protein D
VVLRLRVRLGLLVVLVFAVVATGAAAARAGTTLLVTGHGWGHGVGMSQWGAYGYALHGWKYRRILSHYYPGTTMGRVGEMRVRVLLGQGASVVTIGCAAPMQVTDGRRLTRKLKPGNYGVGPKLSLPVKRRGIGQSFGHLAIFDCARAPLTYDGRAYHGTLLVRSDGSHVSVVNATTLDTYLRGVVPSESPSKWPTAALQAQAVAARSYALAELKPASWYDLVPSTVDQVYSGIAAETPHSDHAVYSTLGQVLMWNGQVARTYYSSSSGGRTEAVEDAWPGSAPIPYLRSVPDPYDVYSPHHIWGPFQMSGATLAGRLGLGSPVESARIVPDGSARALSVQFKLAPGSIAHRSGKAVAQALHLRSTYFSIGSLSLTTSSTRVLYGGAVRVVARTVEAKGALLQQRQANGAWRTLRPVRGGGTAFSLQLRRCTAFRLALPDTSGTSVAVNVTPKMQVKALSPRLLGGEVSPKPNAKVAVWRRERGQWRVVAHPILNEQGAFRTPLPLRPVNYKITVDGDGRLAATQTWLHVTRRLLASLSQ